MRLEATLLKPQDDVATALFDLPAGHAVRVSSGSVVRELTLVDAIPAGHKFAVRDIAEGLRIRKYGEYIGRLFADAAQGAWIHDHNLATSARRDPDHERAWCAPVEVPVHSIGNARTTVGENPLFDARTNRLYWIDVRETPSIHAFDFATGTQSRWPMTEDVGSIALTTRPRLVVGLRSGFAFFEPAEGTLSHIVDPEPHLPHNRLNDGKCDAAGRFWCSSLNPESGLAEGSLYVLDHDLACRRMHGGYFTPNGLAFSVDGGTMYFSDTRRGVIYAFPFDTARGALGERRVFADLGALPGGPDGATVDCEGGLWSAQFDGGCLIRYEANGRMDRVVRLPVSKPTACAFGGERHERLFVTTATRGLDAAQRLAEPMAGCVLVLDVGIGGAAPAAFAGRDSRGRSA